MHNRNSTGEIQFHWFHYKFAPMLHNKSWRNSFFVSSVSYGLGNSILFVLQNACGGVSGDDHCEEVITSIGWVSTCEPNTGLVLVLGIEKKNSFQDGPRLIFTWYEAGINLVCKASIAWKLKVCNTKKWKLMRRAKWRHKMKSIWSRIWDFVSCEPWK